MTSKPDLASRPHGLNLEREMRADADVLYAAFTSGWDRWFAKPGTLKTAGGVGEPYVHIVEHEGRQHPHYGRFLRLEPGRLVELTWVTGKGGTEGAETVLTVTLEPAAGGGTLLKLSHQGFYEDRSARECEAAWPQVLAHLDACMTSGNRESSDG